MGVIAGLLGVPSGAQILPWTLAALGAVLAVAVFFLWRWRSAKRQRDEARADATFVADSAKLKAEADKKLEVVEDAVNADPVAHVRTRGNG